MDFADQATFYKGVCFREQSLTILQNPWWGTSIPPPCFNGTVLYLQRDPAAGENQAVLLRQQHSIAPILLLQPPPLSDQRLDGVSHVSEGRGRFYNTKKKNLWHNHQNQNIHSTSEVSKWFHRTINPLFHYLVLQRNCSGFHTAPPKGKCWSSGLSPLIWRVYLAHLLLLFGLK